MKVITITQTCVFIIGIVIVFLLLILSRRTKYDGGAGGEDSEFNKEFTEGTGKTPPSKWTHYYVDITDAANDPAFLLLTDKFQDDDNAVVELRRGLRLTPLDVLMEGKTDGQKMAASAADMRAFTTHTPTSPPPQTDGDVVFDANLCDEMTRMKAQLGVNAGGIVGVFPSNMKFELDTVPSGTCNSGPPGPPGTDVELRPVSPFIFHIRGRGGTVIRFLVANGGDGSNILVVFNKQKEVGHKKAREVRDAPGHKKVIFGCQNTVKDVIVAVMGIEQNFPVATKDKFFAPFCRVAGAAIRLFRSSLNSWEIALGAALQTQSLAATDAELALGPALTVSHTGDSTPPRRQFMGQIKLMRDASWSPVGAFDALKDTFPTLSDKQLFRWIRSVYESPKSTFNQDELIDRIEDNLRKEITPGELKDILIQRNPELGEDAVVRLIQEAQNRLNPSEEEDSSPQLPPSQGSDQYLRSVQEVEEVKGEERQEDDIDDIEKAKREGQRKRDAQNERDMALRAQMRLHRQQLKDMEVRNRGNAAPAEPPLPVQQHVDRQQQQQIAAWQQQQAFAMQHPMEEHREFRGEPHSIEFFNYIFGLDQYLYHWNTARSYGHLPKKPGQ